ncbi:MAG: patatin-like phospholipase family protein, partial [Alphaproteobacteria bacterium]
MALCLSGGWYRAMLFHTGVLWRLHELGLLGSMARISSVSGGSITAAVLALAWPSLSFAAGSTRGEFVPKVVEPIRDLASKTLDANAIIGGIFLPGTIGERIAKAYDEVLFHGKTLQDLPETPRFVINATNVQSGALWRFSKPYMGDWRVGLFDKPTISLALAVAASSAFPPVLSPLTISLKGQTVGNVENADLHRKPFINRVVLSDGGVYDNLGLETVWKRYKTIFVSDGGGKMQPEDDPHEDWARHSYRVLDLVDNQVRSLRKRQVIGSFVDGTRKGAFWSMRTRIDDLYPVYVKTRKSSRFMIWKVSETKSLIRSHFDGKVSLKKA